MAGRGELGEGGGDWPAPLPGHVPRWAKVTNNRLIIALGVNHYPSQENREGATWGAGHVGAGRGGPG